MMRNYMICWCVVLFNYLNGFTYFNLDNNNTSPKTKIGFILELAEIRGTEVATFDYADYNERLLGNESYIIFLNDLRIDNTYYLDYSSEVQEAFIKRFGPERVFSCKSIYNVNLLLTSKAIDIVYWLLYGVYDKRISQFSAKTAIHAVFDFVPQGDACATISQWQTSKQSAYSQVDTVPHIVRPPIDRSSTLHDELCIPKDSFVFGRHGGYRTFDIPFVKEAIVNFAKAHKDCYFVFLNTKRFCNLPNVIYLDKTWDYNLKEKFINTCDVMIHARGEGETFGLACAEFSIRNKPVITCTSGDKAHIDILGSKALTYTNKQELIQHFTFCITHRAQIREMTWDAYSKEYNPEVVMSKFNTIFILPLTHSNSRS